MDQTQKLWKRREGVFGIASLMAGISLCSLCIMPTVLQGDTARTLLLPTLPQERSFFDLIGITCGCWLLTWMSAVNDWRLASRAGQWSGILIICAEQALLVGVWRAAFAQALGVGEWAAPAVIQIFLLGCLFGFFTLPSLTHRNRRLTGLGTLVLLLPWLMARDAIEMGTEYLHGLMF